MMCPDFADATYTKINCQLAHSDDGYPVESLVPFAHVKQDMSKEDGKQDVKERIIRCDPCRAEGLPCDNGHLCAHCKSESLYVRGSCMVNWMPGAPCGYDRAHKDDVVVGKRGALAKA